MRAQPVEKRLNREQLGPPPTLSPENLTRGRTRVLWVPVTSPLQHLHGFGYNGLTVYTFLRGWDLQLEGSVDSVPRDVTLPSLDRLSADKLYTGQRDSYRDNKGTTRTVQ